MNLRILYPCFFGNVNKVDPDYKFELDLAIQFDYEYMFYDYDLFVSEAILKTNISFSSNELILYRGWMLTDIQYKNLYERIKEKGGNMLIIPEMYNNTHLFPNSYEDIKYYTPKTIWFKEGEKIDWNIVRRYFKKFIIKDFVKSIKGFDFPEFFNDSFSDEELDKYVEKFKEIRGDLYTGGIVFKKFMKLKKTDNHTHEFRAFYINGKVACIYPNSNNDEDIIPLYEAQEIPILNSNFYTVDFAELEDGDLIILEVGDGQVSGIQSERYAVQLYRFLQKLFF